MYFNFKYFDFKTAIKLPFIIANKVSLFVMDGSISLECTPRFGLVKFGVSSIGTVDRKYERTVWEVNGKLTVHGEASIGAGSRISIDETGELEIGNNFTISGRTTINANQHITFGQDCMLSWDIMLMDTDYHKIYDAQGKRINIPKPIRIGNHVWIGSRAVILKGVSISDNVVVAANSTITKNVEQCNCIIGGFGSQVKVLKQDINWER